MTRALVLVIALTAGVAHADAPGAGSDAPAEPSAFDQHLARARELHDQGDFAGARDELSAAYKLDPRPELLFALGQVELNLHHYKIAIDYYERFIATNPAADQVALAQQAIGAARIELARPPVTVTVPPPPHREWDRIDAGLVVLGGVATLAGGGLVAYSQTLAHDHSGTLAAYDRRIDRARTARIGAVTSFAVGAAAIGAALLRWRFHLVETTVEVQPTQGGAAVLVGRSL